MTDIRAMAHDINRRRMNNLLRMAVGKAITDTTPESGILRSVRHWAALAMSAGASPNDPGEISDALECSGIARPIIDRYHLMVADEMRRRLRHSYAASAIGLAMIAAMWFGAWVEAPGGLLS